MGTINKEIKITGKTLMGGEECEVNIFPSEHKGIRFFPKDSKGAVEGIIENVASTQNCTVLANQNGQVRLVEHIMAACGLLGIDGLDICLTNQELPILDGSAKQWVEAFKEAGYETSQNEIKLQNPINFIQNDCLISLVPSESTSVSYMINFEHPELKQRWVNCDFSNIEEIIEARTFGYLKDLEKFQAMGLALGASIDNTVGLTDKGYTTELRSEFEPIKHKILDLAGDLKLAGIDLPQLKANIIAKQAGHSSHVEVAKILKKEIY